MEHKENKTRQEQENKESSCLNTNSITPSIKECERFIIFLNERFNLNLPNDYLITINKAHKNTIGFFMPKEHKEHYTNTNQDLNNINLNTYYLKTNSPYEVLTHELAHFVNHINKIKDCSSNQYHNKHFKAQAEKFFLSVERIGFKGYAFTKETEEFKEMLSNEFKPRTEVFNIFQNQKDKDKAGSRLRLFMCGCGIRVRIANDDFNAECLDCKSKFRRVGI